MNQETKTEPTAEAPVTYVALGVNCWGKGSSFQEAIDNARKNWNGKQRPRNDHFSVHRYECVASEVEVSRIDGSISYPSGTNYEHLQISSLVPKKLREFNESKRGASAN